MKIYVVEVQWRGFTYVRVSGEDREKVLQEAATKGAAYLMQGGVVVEYEYEEMENVKW